MNCYFCKENIEHSVSITYVNNDEYNLFASFCNDCFKANADDKITNCVGTLEKKYHCLYCSIFVDYYAPHFIFSRAAINGTIYCPVICLWCYQVQVSVYPKDTSKTSQFHKQLFSGITTIHQRHGQANPTIVDPATYKEIQKWFIKKEGIK